MSRIGIVGVLALALLAMPADAQKPDKLTLMGHAVHRSVATGAKGGDVAGEWSRRHGIALEWLTFGVPEVHERLFREASLAQGAVDLAFLLNRYVGPRVAQLFEPLDEYLRTAPIEGFGDIAPGMVGFLTFGGKVYGIPYRHATSGLHYNTALLSERGLKEPPRSLEQLLDYARRLTYTRADSTQVHGLIMDGPGPSQMIDLARAWNGDFLTADYRLRASERGMVRAVETLKDLFDRGILPKAFLRFTTENVITFMQQGRAAMAITPFGRYTQFNDPKASKFPGQIQVTVVPVAEELRAELPVAPAKTEFWAFAIPKNARHKDLAWDLIRHLSTRDNTVRAAVNGNGPVRASAYADVRYRSALPYADAEAAVLRLARPPLPGWENAAKAEDIFREEVEAVLVTGKSPQAAMDSVVRRVQPLLPK